MIVDLRSDTVTRPSPEMLDQMMQAPVGDDVFSEDPTIIRLEEKIATLFGMEAGLFCPSGTMANQIAIRAHTGRLNEIICHELSHIYNYENGGYAFNAGVSIRLVRGERGKMSCEEIESLIQPDHDWLPKTTLLSVENTCNKGGGSVLTIEEMRSISECGRKHGLKTHLDGARIFNALITLNEQPSSIHEMFDSISICFSKGLGAPVGSAIVGSRSFIANCRKHRKVMGGGMRQAGILAAACIYALDNNVERLKLDHSAAQRLAEVISAQDYAENVLPVDTNILIFDLKKFTANEFLQKIDHEGIKAVAFGPKTIRLVTHLDFTDEMLNYVIEKLKNLSRQ
ncbi:MAG: threonine aldolase [Chitinophagales bacterium]|nr:threonine aldolase [Chitinophagales bacterium]